MRDPEYDYCPVCGGSIVGHEWDPDSGVYIMCDVDDGLDGFAVEED